MTQDVITVEGYRFVMLWALALVLFFALAAYFGIRQLHAYKNQTAQIRKTWLESTASNVSEGINPSASIQAQQVQVGIYINRIDEIAVHDLKWAADFDLWFHWTNKKLAPGDTFQIANGEIDAREKREEYVSGADRYERYHVKARLAKYFDPTRFPLVDEPLVIQVEDAVHGVDRLNFVADTNNSAISPNAVVHDLVKINQFKAGVRLHDFKSTRGHQSSGSAPSDVHSQFVFAMLVNPPGLVFHLKMFHVLYSSVAIALLALFIKPIHVDPRFGLGVGAVFAAIGNMIAIATFLPRSQQATLSDMINVIGLATIFLTLVQSTISLYQYDSRGLEKLSRLFDRVSFAVLLVGYAFVNIALPWAARASL